MFAHPLIRGILIASVATGTLSACGRSIMSSADLEVRVYDERTGAPIEGAEVEVGYRQAATNAFGVVRLQLPVDAYPVKVRHRAYASRAGTVLLYGGALAVKTMHLPPRRETPQPEPSAAPSASPSPGASPPPGASPAPGPSPLPRPTPVAEARATVFGHVKDQHGKRVSGATVYVESTWGVPFGMVATDANGDYRVGDLPRGSQVKVTAIADGFQPRTRVVRPLGKTQIDFVGAYGLKPASVQAPEGGAVKVKGQVQDHHGRPLDGAIVKVESYDVRYPVQKVAVTRQGAYELTVPAGLMLRFTAGKVGYRSVTFMREVTNHDRQVDFAGLTGLRSAPALEGKAEE